ncbi:M14 family metallopeptidase [Psychroserpens sp. MEBiC05023]
MKLIKFTYLLIFFVSISSCSKKNQDVLFDASFLGASMDSVVSYNDSAFEVYINPAFEPVNKSPWFAFSVLSETQKWIHVTLNYGNYTHRYIPKLSLDKTTWKSIDSNHVFLDTLSGKTTIKLKVSPQKLYVAAQELETSQDTYLWLDSIVNKNPELKKVVAGQTVLNNNNYCIELDREVISNSVVLIARQHPPEIPGGTIGFKAFFEALMGSNSTSNSFRKYFNVYAFPLLNPDGADLGHWRHNAKGVDLNRDWNSFTQPETKMVKNYIENKVKKGTKVQFAIDFHTSYSGPYLLVLDSVHVAKSRNIIHDWIQNIERNSNFEVEARRRSQELPYCYNYFINRFNCEAITYEEGDEVNRDVIRTRAKIYANEFMKTMLSKLENNEL